MENAKKHFSLPSIFKLKPKADSKNDDKASKFPIGISYLYLAIPMYIFMFGWLKLPFALIMAVVLTFGLFKAWRDAPKMEITLFERRNIGKLLIIIALAMLWVYLSGIGGFAFQNYDHMWRNAVLEKLVTQEWPVIITETGAYFDKPAALIYYFALWLPAACFGKIFGLSAAHTFLYWWCVIGVSLVFILLSALNKKISIWLILGFVFFSGLDAVGDFVLHNSTNYIWFANNHLENWAFGFQMSSLTTQLFWVFNQAIPAWLITLLLLCQKDNRSVIFIYSFSFLSCTLPAIGMLPILACIGISRIARTYDRTKAFKENGKPILKEALSFQNLVTGVLTALISYLFLKSNSTGNSGFRMTEIKKLMMSYLIFVLLEFLVYYFAIYKTQKKNPLFWTSLVTLLIVPMISFGPHVDFVMRASIPSLIVLYTLIADSMKKNNEAGDKKADIIIAALLIAGGFTAYHEISRSVGTTIEHSSNDEVTIIANEIDLYEDGARGNFFGEYQDSVFFKYFAKK